MLDVRYNKRLCHEMICQSACQMQRHFETQHLGHGAKCSKVCGKLLHGFQQPSGFSVLAPLHRTLQLVCVPSTGWNTTPITLSYNC